jgi:tetratricopeptide (TPR) repeat protein
MQLLSQGTFPCPDPDLEPKSYVTGKIWIKRLRALSEQNWYSQLQLGVALYAGGELKEAETAWRTSISHCPSAWAYRNLAMLYKNEYKNTEQAQKFLIQAFSLKPNCRPLCIELAALLTAIGEDAKWLEVEQTLSPAIRAWGRIRLYRAIALIHLDQPEQAATIINQDFGMPDIKEGELSVSTVWFDLYRRLYAKETGVPYDPENTDLITAADQKYPLPRSLDFRMH